MTSDAEPCFDSQVVSVNGRSVIMCRGELDMTGVDGLWERVEQVLCSGRPLVFDLSGTTFIDSSGLSLLARAYRTVGQIQEGVVLRAPTPAVLQILTLAGCDQMFTIERPEPG
jgi:anti-sigma B factor antagonist